MRNSRLRLRLRDARRAALASRRPAAAWVLLVLCASAPAEGQEPKSPGFTEAADNVLLAIRSKDDALLRDLAARDVPDPWVVADLLIARGELDAAERFAMSAPRRTVERLPAYVASRRGRDETAARRAFLAAEAAMRGGNGKSALSAIEGASEGAGELLRVRIGYLRAVALRLESRWTESVDASLAAAEEAERLGWWAFAGRVISEAFDVAHRRRDLVLAAKAGERELAWAESWASPGAIASAVNKLAVTLYDSGDARRARELFERGLREFEALGDWKAVAGVRGNLGLALQRLGEPREALACFEKALEGHRAAGNRSGAAASLVNLGLLHHSLGDYSRSLEWLEQGLAEAEAIRHEAWASNALQGIASVQDDLGNHKRALEIYARALEKKEAIGDRLGAARILGLVGVVYMSTGDFAKALDCNERAYEAIRALGDRSGAAIALSNIGTIHGALGDYPRALRCLERAVEDLDAGGSRSFAAVTRGKIGEVLLAMGDPAKAQTILERTLEDLRATGDRAGAAKTRITLGAVQRAMGNPAKAIEILEKAAEELEELGRRGQVAFALLDIGRCQLSLRDPARAAETLERAARLAERLRETRTHVFALSYLAEARLHAREFARAMDAAHQAVRSMELIVAGLGEEEGPVARESFKDVFAIGAQAAALQNDVEEMAYFLESGRAGSLLEALGGRQSMRSAGLPEALGTAEAEARGKERLALGAYQRVLQSADREAIRGAADELDAARERLRQVVERIQRESKRSASVWYPRAATLEEIQGWLAEGDVLVTFCVGDPAALALRVTRDSAAAIDLGRSRPILEACDGVEARSPSGDCEAGLARLRTLLVEPLRLSGPDVRRILWCPEGPISYLPPAALLPGVPIVLVPSASTYGLLVEEEGRKRGAAVLALGDPDYSVARNATAVSTFQSGGGPLASLPGTRAEATAVGDSTLLGAEATESGLRAAIAKRPRWRAVHLACHGFVNPDRAMLSSLALTPDAENDGYLTALEVLDWSVPADLVVLSACETGTGRIVHGEGIVGLTRAFMFAGSPRVLCSLWKVDDEATRALMTRFYELWNPREGDGLPAAEALRRAQESVRSREKWRHPYFWAAWVLWGLPS